MENKQIIAIVSLPILFLVMYPVFQILKNRIGNIELYGKNKAWYVGIIIYWIFWCLIYPIIILDSNQLYKTMIPGQIGLSGIIFLFFPIMITFIGRYFFKFEKITNRKELIVLSSSAIIMGTLEEILWRGVFIVFFPGNILWGLLWPTVWFSIWHLAPGSISIVNKWMLAIGALAFGLCWGVTAFLTGSIFWTIISHISVGLIRVLNIERENA